ncbi:hypothetical protein [Rhodococcus koreensis]
MQLTIDHQSVWVPWLDGPRKLHGDEAMLVSQVEELGFEPQDGVLVLNAHGDDPFGLFGRERTITPRSDIAPRGGPVFAHYPDQVAMVTAISRARGAVLAVMEGLQMNLRGWAAATGAIDARTGVATTGVPADVRRLLERIMFYGNNGYGGAKHSPAGSMVPGIAGDIGAAGYSNDFIVSYLYAAGLDRHSEKNLRALID